MNPYGAITDVIDPAHQQALAKQVAVMARMAVSAEGKDTLLLPSAEMAAWHEAGHAIMHAITGVPIERVMIWPAPAYGGFSGRCVLPPSYKPASLIAHQEPNRALVRACNTLAGWAAEYAYSGAQVAMGSSLDEQILAENLSAIAATVLGIDASEPDGDCVIIADQQGPLVWFTASTGDAAFVARRSAVRLIKRKQKNTQ